MANTNKPNGMRPRMHVDGSPWASAMNRYAIGYSYATAMGIGDPVTLTSGKLAKAAATDVVLGVLVGFEQPKVSTFGVPVPGYWPAGGFATLGNQDCYGLVVDDPNVLFEAQFGSAADATTVVAQTDAGTFFKTFDKGVSTGTGLSGVGMDVSTKNASSSGLVWQFIRYVERPDNDTASGFARGLFLPLRHLFRAAAA